MSDKCRWLFLEYESDFGGYVYDTECEERYHIFPALNHDDNNYKYCPYCGKPIEEVEA